MGKQTPRELIEHAPQLGRLDWIGVRPARGAPMLAQESALLLADRGIEGDRAASAPGGKRQVTLIMSEHLELVAQLMLLPRVDPALLRRNLVVRGVNLHALARRRFAIGECVLEGTGDCHPCSKMEAALGDGGYSAMRGHSGIVARILTGGSIRLGDLIRALPVEKA